MSPATAITELISHRFHPYNTRSQKQIRDLLETCTEIYNTNFNLSDQIIQEENHLGDPQGPHNSIAGDNSPIGNYSELAYPVEPYRPESPLAGYLDLSAVSPDPLAIPTITETGLIGTTHLFNSPTPRAPSLSPALNPETDNQYLITDPIHRDLIDSYHRFGIYHWTIGDCVVIQLTHTQYLVFIGHIRIVVWDKDQEYIVCFKIGSDYYRIPINPERICEELEIIVNFPGVKHIPTQPLYILSAAHLGYYLTEL
ncbi:hypothetical protein BOTBODRAFT_181910 [Botryobasidium botryosum FD-172 SS1]|uniref:Uncharacterized protein n=1 Tax=Botryobasidium botryosum (strain FD-172 SS1) TaxID=930990 RepID=A0A067LS73_BOTB1|nr:hypothetical protein BOTBODRAFT_181910 [Botryobasidium botryosum FD-172 SS1]